MRGFIAQRPTRTPGYARLNFEQGKKMATKKTAQQAATYHIEHCNVTNTNAPTNEHTRDAVVALAVALEANANALAEAARALKGGNVTMDSAIRVGV